MTIPKVSAPMDAVFSLKERGFTVRQATKLAVQMYVTYTVEGRERSAEYWKQVAELLNPMLP